MNSNTRKKDEGNKLDGTHSPIRPTIGNGQADAKVTKKLGCFEVALYNGNYNGSTALSVIRAWDMGESHTIIRKDPCVSWKIYEGDYEMALALYKSLEKEWDVERLCDPAMRNPRATRTEEIMEFRRKYEVDGDG